MFRHFKVHSVINLTAAIVINSLRVDSCFFLIDHPLNLVVFKQLSDHHAYDPLDSLIVYIALKGFIRKMSG